MGPTDFADGDDLQALLVRSGPTVRAEVARLQCLDGYVDLPLAWQFQTALVHLPKLT